MADSADLWGAIGTVIDDAAQGPTRKNGSPIFAPSFPRWYRGATHPTVIDGEEKEPPPGYFLLGLELETEAGWYNGEASQDYLGRIHCWGWTPDDARRLYRWLKQQLHGTTLTVEGYDPVTLLLSKSGPTADEGATAWQVEATMTGELQEA